MLVMSTVMSRVYVLFGTRYGFITMTEGFTVFGTHEFDLTGWSVSSAGDVNNDTLADIVIGAPASHGTGAIYVLYGRVEVLNGVEVRLSELTVSEGFVIHGMDTSPQDAFGLSVSDAGDVNGDGCDDIIVGALRPTKFNAGVVHILFGKAGFRQKVEFSGNEMSPDDELVVIQGAPWSWFSFSLSSTGDINDDNCSDIIVGGLHTSYVVYGSRTTIGLPHSVADISTEHGFHITGGGILVKGPGDINSNRHDDLFLVGNVDLSHSAGLALMHPDNSSVLSAHPTATPTVRPSQLPSKQPTYKPTVLPTTMPTALPTQHLSRVPSLTPIYAPSGPSAAPTTAAPTVSHRPSQASRAPTLSPTGGTPTYQPSSSFSVPTLKPVQVLVRPTIAPNMMTTDQPSHILARFKTIRTVFVADNMTNNYTLHNNTLSMIHYIVNTTQHVTIKGPTLQCIFTLLPAKDGQLTLSGFSNTTDVFDLTSFAYIRNYQEFLSHATQDGGDALFIFKNGQVLKLIDTTIAELVEINFMFYDGPPIDDHDERHAIETGKNKNKRTSYVTIVGSALSGAFVVYIAYKLWLFWMDYRTNISQHVHSAVDSDRFYEIFIPDQAVFTLNDQKSCSYNSSGSGSSSSSGSGSSSHSETKTNDSDTTTSINSKEFEQTFICDLNRNTSDSCDDLSKSSGFLASATQHSQQSLMSPKNRIETGMTERSRFYSEDQFPTSPAASVLHVSSVSESENENEKDSICDSLSDTTSSHATNIYALHIEQSKNCAEMMLDRFVCSTCYVEGDIRDCSNDTVDSVSDTHNRGSVSSISELGEQQESLHDVSDSCSDDNGDSDSQ